MRELTDFERENGYTPCPFNLGDQHCGVRVPSPLDPAEQHRPATCRGTHEDCARWGNLERFGGQLVPGHPLATAVMRAVPFVRVTIEEDA